MRSESSCLVNSLVEGEVANLHAHGIKILYINGPITWTKLQGHCVSLGECGDVGHTTIIGLL